MRNDTAEITRLDEKMDRALAIFAQDEADLDGAQLDIAGEYFRDVLFKVARSPITEPKQLGIINKAIGYLLTEKPEPFPGSQEGAIDVALEEAIEESSSPRQTALLALVRYRIEEQRRAAA